MLDKEQELMAFNNQPLPPLTACDSVAYLGLRFIGQAYKAHQMTKEQATEEKNKLFRQLAEIEKAHTFEIKCWEQSARRTLAADHAMTVYRNNRTLENADKLVRMLEWLADETANPAVFDHGAMVCPNCRQPVGDPDKFCCRCGQRLRSDAGDP